MSLFCVVGEGKQVWVVSDWVEDYYNHPNAGVSEYFATDSDVLCTQFGTKVCDTRGFIIQLSGE